MTKPPRAEGMIPDMTRRYVHIKTGNVYEALRGDAMMKHPDTGEWIEAVIYIGVDGESPLTMTYCRSKDSFTERFRADD